MFMLILNNWVCRLADIAGATMLVPCHEVQVFATHSKIWHMNDVNSTCALSSSDL